MDYKRQQPQLKQQRRRRHSETRKQQNSNKKDGYSYSINNTMSSSDSLSSASHSSFSDTETNMEYDETKFYPMRYCKWRDPSTSLYNVKMEGVQGFMGEWDREGVYVYQAYNDEIADYAIANKKLGGPLFDDKRMSWIKPSFAWMLYRSGYGTKHNQNRVLKIKLSHETMANILSRCFFVDTNKATINAVASKTKKSHSKEDGNNFACSNGRVQWDPERDIMTADGKVPRALLRDRAIQIGLQGKLSAYYVDHILSVEDVTELAHKVRRKQRAARQAEQMKALLPFLPVERPYMPCCSEKTLIALGMLPGETADILEKYGRGKVEEIKMVVRKKK